MGADHLRRRTLGSIALTSALLLGACGSGGNTESTAEDEKKANIAAVIKGLDNPFFQNMQNGIEARSSSLNLPANIQAAASINDTTGQADRLTAVAGQNFSCYIVNPTDSTNLLQPLATIAARNKTIVNIDQPVDQSAAEAINAKPDTYIGTDNKDAGKKVAEELERRVLNGGKVAIITGIAGNVTSSERVQGFTEALGQEFTVAETTNGDWNRELARAKASEILRANPDLVGFFAANDDMGLGVADAVVNAGKTIDTVKVISVDGNPDAIDAIKAGTLTATVAQYPYVIGALAVEACQAAALGKTLPANVASPTEVVTKQTAEAAEAAAPMPYGTYQNPLADLLRP